MLAPAFKSLISVQLCFIALLGFRDSQTAAVIVFRFNVNTLNVNIHIGLSDTL